MYSPYATWGLLFAAFVKAISISDIQGPAFQSPYAGHVVHDVTGVVAAKVCSLASFLDASLDGHRAGRVRLLARQRTHR